MNIFTVKVKIIIKKIGFNPLNINESGTFDKRTTRLRKKTADIKPKKSFTRNKEIIYANVLIIFTRGSSL